MSILKKIKHRLYTLEHTSHSRLFHLTVGVVVISFFAGIGVGSVSKALHISYLKQTGENQKKEQMMRMESLLRQAEMDIDLAGSRY